MADHQNPVLVVDFGAQYAQLIARRVRECQVYSEIVPFSMPLAQMLAKAPAAIILSGGPKSVYADGAPELDPAIVDAGIPVLGICYGHQVLGRALGGEVARSGVAEYGRTQLQVIGGQLHDGAPESMQVWMSHGDSLVSLPEGIEVTACTEQVPIAAFEDRDRRLYGVQYHPEVVHTPFGTSLIRNFLTAAGISPAWTMESIITAQVAAIRAQVGDGRAICGLSGGVDSAVAAALVHRAIGDRLTCVFVDHGLLRKDEARQVQQDFAAAFGIDLVTVDAADRFFGALAGITDPETKRKTIGAEFIRCFEQAAKDIESRGHVGFLVQGTLYPDVIESGSATAATIKSHHNVGGLPDDLEFDLVEPLRLLFKDEVRAVGRELGLPDEIVNRQPFPGPGLAVRIIGEVTAERVALLQDADAIVRTELARAGLEAEIWQCYAALLADIRSVGVMGDERTYGHPIVVRAVTSEDAMTADWARIPHDVLDVIASRIIAEVPGINRVVYDITSKPPGTIEWE